MASITATPDVSTGTVELALSTVYGVSGILRSDVNGTRPVRLRAGALDGSGARTFTDYEAAFQGNILYRVEHSTSPGQDWTSLAGVELPRFVLPSVPQFAVSARAVTSYSARRRSRAKFHEVIDRASPLVATARMGLRSGSLEAVFETYTEAADLLDVLERGQTVMYRQREHPGLDMYFHSESVSITADPEQEAWRLGVDFVEVAFPPGNVLSGANWTFDAVADTYATFDEVAQRFETFNDLTIGQERRA